MRILHVLDHSLPLHSGYTFRTLAILREQRRAGLGDLPPHQPQAQARSATPRKSVDGLAFLPHADRPGERSRLPGIGRELDVMRPPARRLRTWCATCGPTSCTRIRRCSTRCPRCGSGRRTRHSGGLRGARLLGGRRGRPRHHARKAACATALTRALETYALRRAEHVTTICEGLRRDIVARGIDAAQGHGDPERGGHRRLRVRRAADAALRATARPGRLPRSSASSARSTPTRGSICCSQAVAACCARDPDVRVLLVGGGPQEEALRSAGAASSASDTRASSPAACRTTRCSATTT